MSLKESANEVKSSLLDKLKGYTPRERFIAASGVGLGAIVFFGIIMGANEDVRSTAGIGGLVCRGSISIPIDDKTVADALEESAGTLGVLEQDYSGIFLGDNAKILTGKKIDTTSPDDGTSAAADDLGWVQGTTDYTVPRICQ